MTVEDADGTLSDLHYDYLVNETGPYLNFEERQALGPVAGNTMSVCTVEHAVETRDRYLEIIRAAHGGKRRRIVVGVGHPAATCEGAGFEQRPTHHGSWPPSRLTNEEEAADAEHDRQLAAEPRRVPPALYERMAIRVCADPFSRYSICMMLRCAKDWSAPRPSLESYVAKGFRSSTVARFLRPIDR